MTAAVETPTRSITAGACVTAVMTEAAQDRHDRKARVERRARPARTYGLWDGRVFQVTPPRAMSRIPALNMKSDSADRRGRAGSPIHISQATPRLMAPANRAHGPPADGAIRRATSAKMQAPVTVTSDDGPQRCRDVARRHGSEPLQSRRHDRDPGEEQDQRVGRDSDEQATLKAPEDRREDRGHSEADAGHEEDVADTRERGSVDRSQIPGEHAEAGARQRERQRNEKIAASAPHAGGWPARGRPCRQPQRPAPGGCRRAVRWRPRGRQGSNRM